MNENQLEEKSLKEYKEQKGIFQWIKSTFAKLKERFRPTKNEIFCWSKLQTRREKPYFRLFSPFT